MKQYLYTRVVIVDDNGKHTSKSYPRFLVEQNIGRELLPNEDVHHKDGGVTNNNINNLEIIFTASIREYILQNIQMWRKFVVYVVKNLFLQLNSSVTIIQI